MNSESTLALEQDLAKTLNIPSNEVERQFTEDPNSPAAFLAELAPPV
jgi:hypothetical protein